MKKLILTGVLLSLVSCGNSKEEAALLTEEGSSRPPYDTIAIDSFSTGALSVDVARKIRMSSPEYVDSVKAAKVAIEQENILKKTEAEKLEQDKKAATETAKKENTPRNGMQ